MQAMKKKLKDMYNIEKLLAIKNECTAQFDHKWNTYVALLS